MAAAVRSPNADNRDGCPLTGYAVNEKGEICEHYNKELYILVPIMKNRMKMPGFSAELSLHVTGRSYHQIMNGCSSVPVVVNPMVPMNKCCCRPSWCTPDMGNWCIDCDWGMECPRYDDEGRRCTYSCECMGGIPNATCTCRRGRGGDCIGGICE